MNRHLSRRASLQAMGALALAGLGNSNPARAACCYFSAKDKDVSQPAQKAFLTWEPARDRESFTVQPKFEGNADDFGMVIPTPARPKLDEMPRDFFKSLAVFTILEPTPLAKFKGKNFRYFALGGAGAMDKLARRRVAVLEQGIVGSLDYKIIKADDAKDLYAWLDEHRYRYAGDAQTLDFYVRKGWFFTVMKIDPKQMKRRPDGTYAGDVTPTKFTFESRALVYPLRITRPSVHDRTEALFYVQAPEKMDLAGSFSYRYSWQTMWAQAMSFAVEKTPGEKEWEQHIGKHLGEFQRMLAQIRQEGFEPATLEWAKRIMNKDIDVMDGRAPYNRDAPPDEVSKLKLLRGHVRQEQFVTKFRKVFRPGEMTDDLVLARATAGDKPDPTEYTYLLPTSPP